MSAWFAAIGCVVCFVLLCRTFQLTQNARRASEVAKEATGIIRDAELSDDDKEGALQSSAKALFLLSAKILFAGLLAIAVPFGLTAAGGALGLFEFDVVMTILLSLPFLIGCIVLGCVLSWTKKALTTDSTSPYGLTDRLLHKLAYYTKTAQLGIADMEDRMFAKELAGTTSNGPVLITGLPRSGTTLLLEVLSQGKTFAAHSYRDMPFVLTPCLWDKFSRRHQREIIQRERAHGDGMMIDVDSPEALEEIIWAAHWPSHYQQDRILPWKSDETHPDFEDFLRQHMKKITWLRNTSCGHPSMRYVSKNNANISRIGFIRQHIPDATLLIPFRDPIQHAASLLKQHKNFLQLHAEDPFSSFYMKSIGHFDFGNNLRPIDFDGWLDLEKHLDPLHISFWLIYWDHAYRHILSHLDTQTHLLDYDELCSSPEKCLGHICQLLDCQPADLPSEKIKAIRPPSKHPVELPDHCEDLLHRVHETHRELRLKA